MPMPDLIDHSQNPLNIAEARFAFRHKAVVGELNIFGHGVHCMGGDIMPVVVIHRDSG